MAGLGNDDNIPLQESVEKGTIEKRVILFSSGKAFEVTVDRSSAVQTSENAIIHTGILGDDVSGYDQSGLFVPTYLEDKRDALLEMGFKDSGVKIAIRHFRNMGIIHLTLDEFIGTLVVLEEEVSDIDEYDTLLQENQRLRSIVYCMICNTNHVGTLFLPCAHNRTCTDCAEPLVQCPACKRNIEEKIMTRMSKRI